MLYYQSRNKKIFNIITQKVNNNYLNNDIYVKYIRKNEDIR